MNMNILYTVYTCNECIKGGIRPVIPNEGVSGGVGHGQKVDRQGLVQRQAVEGHLLRRCRGGVVHH